MKVMGFQADHAGCGYYRMELPFSRIKQAHDAILDDKVGAEHFATTQDIVFLQRQYNARAIPGYLKMRDSGAAIVYESDDYLLDIDPTNPCAEEYSKVAVQDGIADYFALSDAMVVSTDRLKVKYSQFLPADSIFVVPNHLDYKVWDEHLKFREANKPTDKVVRVGWHGSATHFRDLAEIAPALFDILSSTSNVRLVVVGWNFTKYFPKFKKVREKIEFRDWGEPQDFGRKLYDIDIGLAPLALTEFNRCKSHIKHLEYSALGIPTIATSIDPYAEVETHGGVLIKGNGRKAWSSAIMNMVNHADGRVTRGAIAKAKTRDKYDIDRGWVRWVAAFEEARKIRADRRLIVQVA